MIERRFVIPDIHGCFRTFRSLLADVIRLQKEDNLYLLGDTIDRGPHSREVLDSILRLQSEGYKVNPLRGNHEEMLLTSCRDRSMFHLWMLNGGHATLASFSVEDGCDIPRSYRDFIAGWPTFIKLADFILVHAGLNFRIADPFADTEAMLWSRDTFIDTGRLGGRRLVCGHTPLPLEEIQISLGYDRIMLDNGCVYKGEAGMGCLAALELNSLELYFRENIDV